MRIATDEKPFVNQFIEQVGLSFGIPDGRHGKTARFAVFKCSCGQSFVLRMSNVTRQKSCGCLWRKTGARRKKHGKAKTKVYVAWMSMKSRCFNENHRSFHHYGGRGISVCERWMNFENFYEDMGDPPDGYSLDRKNNSLGYSKENCRWSTNQEQLRNTRSNVMIEYRGETRCVSEWATIFGFRPNDILNRIRSMSFEKAISFPVKRQKRRRE